MAGERINTPEFYDYEQAPNVDLIEFRNFIGENISGAIVEPEKPTEPHQGVLIIPGIPEGSKNNPDENLFTENLYTLSQDLAEQGMYSMLFNPPGMGRSEGYTDRISLRELTTTWIQASRELRERKSVNPKSLKIIGMSMGSHVAARLSTELPEHGFGIDKLALISPYFYSNWSQRAPMNKLFGAANELTRRFGNFENSPAYRDLQNFKGELLLTYVKNDEPIPEEVQALAEQQLEVAIHENRGVGFSQPYVEHAFRPSSEVDEPEAKADATLIEVSQTISKFLSQ